MSHNDVCPLSVLFNLHLSDLDITYAFSAPPQQMLSQTEPEILRLVKRSRLDITSKMKTHYILLDRSLEYLIFSLAHIEN